MLDPFDRTYAELVFNANVLLTNFTGCKTVDRLQLLSAGLMGIVILRFVLQAVLLLRLKRWSSIYTESDAPELRRLYGEAVRAAGLRCAPALYKFRNIRPLAFTIGTIRPAIFLAPRLVRDLSTHQLRALLMHELAHVKRLDALRLWVFELFSAAVPLLMILLFAVHFVSGSLGNVFLLTAIGTVVVIRLFIFPKLVRYNERRCDDFAVSITNDPVGLASSLLRVAEAGIRLPRSSLINIDAAG